MRTVSYGWILRTHKGIWISQTLVNLSMTALPGLYSFTGIDYTPAFYNKRKIKPYELMKKNKKYIELFASFEEAPITEEMIYEAEMFACEMYGFPKVTKLSEARYVHFKTK